MPADAPPTFSESWYRIATQKIYLRPGVRVKRQNYRGERWYVLENPFSNQFFRLRPAAYEFVARLRAGKTVSEVWAECVDKFPDEAPGQEAVLQLLAQLYHANLIQYDHATDTAKLFERYEKIRQRERGFFFTNLMFMRFPLLDPNDFLNRTIGIVGKLISPVGAIIWFIMVGIGLKFVVDNFQAFKDQSEGVLAPQNLFMLYAGMVIIKALHEFGHAYFTKKFGGEVHVMGIMLMIFTPMPYMDATAAWSFRNRWQRVLVGAAGMIVEIFVAAIAVVVWAKTPPGSALHSLAYNMIFVASVSTVIFNINPLLRYDGYYILSDLLEIPNLQQRSYQHLRYLAERYLYGLKKVETPAETKKEAAWYTFYGIGSAIYRVLVFGGILLVVADRFMLLGIIMAVICAISWITVPIGKLIIYLATSPRLERQRTRAVVVTLCLAGGLMLALDIIPFPSHFRAPGVVQAREWTQVANETPGKMDTLLAKSGSKVVPGQPLAQLVNPEMDMAIVAALATQKEVESRLTQAMKEDSANMQPLRSKLDSTRQRLNQLLTDKTNLLVRARQEGIFISPQAEEFKGRWLAKGSGIGIIVNPTTFEFLATVSQADGARVFTGKALTGEICLKGEARNKLTLGKTTVVPAEQRMLPSPALGWMAGGEVVTSMDDPQGRKASEGFFEVHGDVERPKEGAETAMLLHGRSGQVRFDLEPEPLLPRWIRLLRQMIQKRYQI